MKPVTPGVDNKDNPLASAEMSAEGNYNMIDGIINNTLKPSILDKIKEYERLIMENPDNAVECAVLEVCPASDR